jgi:hypothetical protein
MKTFPLILAAAAAGLALTAVSAPAEAAGANPLLVRDAAPERGTLVFGGTGPGASLEQAQWLFGGRQYCWYDRGWRGPGWYWCGYAYRRGYGWGGPVGWRGWDRGHPPMGRGGYRGGAPGFHGDGHFEGGRPGGGHPEGGHPEGGHPGGGEHGGGRPGGGDHGGGEHGGGERPH